MSVREQSAHIVLVPGFWLGGWAWDEVAADLAEAGYHPHPLTLPGLGSVEEDRTGLTLEDHVAAVREVVAELDGPVVLVAHSGAAPVAHGVVDQDPTRISRVVYVDCWPNPDGMAIFPDLPADDPDFVMPEWEALEEDGNSLEGIDDDGLRVFRERSVPQPAGVARSKARLVNDGRLDVPITVICTSAPAEMLRDAVDTGQPWAAELAQIRDVELVDLPTGHWPMFSKPADLAQAIIEAVRR